MDHGQAHRKVTRVKSVSSLPLILMFLAMSAILAFLSVPLWDTVAVLGTSFGVISSDEVRPVRVVSGGIISHERQVAFTLELLRGRPP